MAPDRSTAQRLGLMIADATGVNVGFAAAYWLRYVAELGGDIAAQATRQAATTLAQAAPTATPTPTPKPTKVVKPATASSTPSKKTATPTAKPTKRPTATPTPQPTDTPTPERVNVIRNGGFEWGFAENGVANQWRGFTNGGAKYIFAAEQWPLAVRNGDQAQRITVYEAHLPDRYAGIYQTVAVVPGQAYWLTMHGQSRTDFGDVKESQYGYRMQYAVDWSGGTNWQDIPAEEWVELPWDEQLLDDAGVEFLDYSANLVPPTGRLTLFIRVWNKWPNPLEAQYTLDTISLIGPQPEEVLFDQPLPDTGGADGTGLPADPRVWGSILFLIVLLAGAAGRRKITRPAAK
ncbi:MAG: hypothetical protein ACE5G8_15700 [Anaerolineae bacterium]